MGPVSSVTDTIAIIYEDAMRGENDESGECHLGGGVNSIDFSIGLSRSVIFNLMKS